jgi:hypothetical protein
MRNRIGTLMAASLLASVAWGQSQPPAQQSMPGDGAAPSHNMQNMDMPNMKGMPTATGKDAESDSDAGAHVMTSMEGHMDMGPHMKMTVLRAPKPGDAEQADRIVKAARIAAEKYVDYHTALTDGFKIFLPNFPQKIYHFTNYSYAMEAAFSFNPDHPTSLLYEKHGEDYKLIGVMYTAPKRFSEDDLNQRIPLSVAQWTNTQTFSGR